MPSEKLKVELPEELFEIAKLDKKNASAEVKKLISLELFRENAVSLGKAAEMAEISIADFMELSASRGINLHYTLEDLVADRETAKRLGL